MHVAKLPPEAPVCRKATQPIRFSRMRRAACMLAVLVAMISTACGVSKSGGTVAADAAPQQPGLLRVSNDQLARLRIVAVEPATWATTIRTTGTVDWDADHTTQAISQVSGPIARILVDTGAIVKKGDPLLYVSSPDVAAAISTYKKAHNQQEFTRRSLSRAQELVDRGAVAQKDLDAAQTAYNDVATDVQTSLQTLKIFDITKQELEEAQKQGVPISPELAVRAPIGGMVVQKLVSPGMLVQAGATTCFMLSDVSTVWVQGHVFDRDLAAVHVGDRVDETNASIPSVFHGVLSYIGAQVDIATRTTPVRIVTPNPHGLLKKDTFVEAVIHSGAQRHILAAPVSAVMRTSENEPFVYLQAEPGRFAQRLVTVGEQQDDRIEILSGLKPGDLVVSQGSLFLQFANSNQ